MLIGYPHTTDKLQYTELRSNCLESLTSPTMFHMVAATTLVAVLDDEPEMRKALRRVLASRGFRVDEYERGEDLFAAIETHTPDCLVLDLRMPGLDGFCVLEAFRCRHIRLPVVVVTALDEPDTEQQVLALGASACLKKPVDREVLLSAIAEAMAGAQRPLSQGKTEEVS